MDGGEIDKLMLRCSESVSDEDETHISGLGWGEMGPGAEIQIAGSEWKSYVTLMEVRHEYWNLDGGWMQI